MHDQDNPAGSPRVRTPEPVRAYAAMNTVRALEHLAFRALSTSELADSLQVSVRNARRLLQRLQLEGFVTQEPRGPRRRYQATLRIAALGRQMLDHVPVAQAAVPRVAQLARDCGGAAHLWIAGYDEQLVCAVHADALGGGPAVGHLWHLSPAPSTAPGNVLLADRLRLRSCCYVNAAEPAFAAAVLHHGRVVAALGVTGDGALDASGAVVAAAAGLSRDLASAP